MRLIFLGTVYLLFFGLGARTEGSFNLTEEERSSSQALWKIENAKWQVANSLKKLPVAQHKLGSFNNLKNELDSKLNGMKNELKAMSKGINENGELTNGGNSGKIKSIGDAATSTASLIHNAVNGDFSGPQGKKKLANAIIKTTETFLNIGGAFAPPPIGQAISTGFGILNTFMAMAGLTPKVPSQREIMQELLDEQTREIKGMVDKVLATFWEEILADSKAVLNVLQVPLDLLNQHINIKAECGAISKINDYMTKADTKMIAHLAKLVTKIRLYCAGEKAGSYDAQYFMTAADENKCLILLENYSEIYKMFVDMNEAAIQIFNKHENMSLSMCPGSNGIACPGSSGLVCIFHIRIESETKKLTNVLNLGFGYFKPKTSTTCLKTKVLTPDKFIFTKYALTAAGVNLRLGHLTKNEESGKDIVCPSSKTKLMLVGRDTIEILSPSKKCDTKIPTLRIAVSNMLGRKHNVIRPAAAFYRTRRGDERIMVCGGQKLGSHYDFASHRCQSINSKSGSEWKIEADLPMGVTKPSMAFDSYNMHVFGGYTSREIQKYSLDANNQYNGAYEELTPKDDHTYTAAMEQVWQMDFTKAKYAWKVTEPPYNSKDYNKRYRSIIGAKCTVFHDGQFYSQGLKWIKNEISGPAQYTNKKSYHNIPVQTMPHTTYTAPIPGCIMVGANRIGAEETISWVYTMSACQYKCDERSWCRSVSYTQNFYNRPRCALSKYTKKSDSAGWTPRCRDTFNFEHYISSKYSEKIIHDPVSSANTWNDLPPYANSLIYSCTVGVIFGQTSFVTSGPQGVYHFPIPYTPETNPQWKRLEKQPTRVCDAGLGWADGKLLCVPKWSRKFYYNKDFYYFDEHVDAWMTRKLKKFTYGMDAYVTVSATFDENMCEK